MSSAPPSALRRLLVALAAWLPAAWLAFTFSFTPLRSSTDEWWHLKTGEYIGRHGLPSHDIFTYTAQNLPWNNHEWLTEWLMWQVYRAGEAMGFGGWRAIILWKTLVIMLAFTGFAWLLRGRRLAGSYQSHRSPRPHVTDPTNEPSGLSEAMPPPIPSSAFSPIWPALAASLAVALARRTFYPRPPFVTYLMLAVEFYMLIEWRSGRLRERWLWLLAPLFALWANLHGGWLAGLALAGAFWADAALAALISLRARDGRASRGAATRDPEPLRRLGRLTLIGMTFILGTLCNPFGWHLYGLAGRVMNDKFLLALIYEMTPPDPRHVWVLRGVFALLGFCGFFIAVSRNSKMRGALRWGIGIGGGLGFSALVLVVFWQLAFREHDKGNPPLPPISLLWPQLALACAAIALLLALLRPPGALAHFLAIAFFAYEGIFHVRHLPLLAIIILPLLVWSLETTAAALPAMLSRYADGLGFAALLALTIFWTFNHLESYSYWERNLMLAEGTELQPGFSSQLGPPAIPGSLPQGNYRIDAYPIKAMDFLLRAKLPGPIFNEGNVSGYLIWRLAPEHYKLFTDNRYDIFGGLVIRQEKAVVGGWSQAFLDANGMSAAAGFDPWDWVLDHWKIQTVLLPTNADGNLRLQASRAWTQVYEDFQLSIWVRNNPENTAIIQNALALPRTAPW